ncbi:MAG TPA: sigma-54 dependent transcriptional regulator [Thermoanaerobaculia bacterium]|nr:sigma-54 dependent transcriptional regulator [Thermoanaerobaculia bacterium]
MQDFRVLIVDDEAEFRSLLTQALSREFETGSASDGQEALQAMERRPYDLVLLDHGLKGLSGLDVLRLIKSSHPETYVLMVTAFNDLSLVIECIRAGAEDYIVKPIVIDAVKQKILTLSKQRDLASENHQLRAQLDQRHRFDELLGESPAFLEMLAMVERVSALNIPVLIHGESGTGKELVARAIHKNSRRHDRAFLGINCPTFPDTLLVSELFGHVRGAFTNAHYAKKGLFVAADGGTLFMDEIGETSMNFQAQLLRVIETGEVLPLGSTTLRVVDVRLVAATNRNLEHEVERGTFRRDLFYRLWKVPIRVPALRERRADIPVLANAFLRRYNRDLNKNVIAFSEEAMRLLVSYAWPGNVRELQNVIERAVILQDGDHIEAHDLRVSPERHDGASDGQFFECDWQEAKRRFVRAYIRKAIAKAGGNVSQAARNAGMDRGNFRDKMKLYGISADEAV